ncbi:MAG: type 1 glutamine amidotransferase [Leucobacter sp.]
MNEARILVIEHQRDAGLGQLSARLAENGCVLEVVGPDTGRPLPDSLEGFDALIVLGGSMGPTEDDRAPWLPAARDLLAEGVDRRVPTLGVCLGAQLLATATGGHVRTMPAGPEVGLCAVRFESAAENDPLFGQLAHSEARAVQWHWLEADALPADATILASSDACRNQAFRLGDTAWGVQFHPEALDDTVREWSVEDRASLEQTGLAARDLIAEVRAAEGELRGVWGGVADRFAGVVKRAMARQPSA